MAWRVEISPAAKRGLDKRDQQVAHRILKFLFERVVRLDDPRSIGEALQGPRFGEFWEYRVGDSRVIARIEDGQLLIVVLKAGNRREIYQR